MKDIWNWLVSSSADPEKTSLMLKGFMTVGSGYILNLLTAACGLGLVCVGLTVEWFNEFVSMLTSLALGVLYVIGAIVAIYGAVRKVGIRMGRWSAR